MAASLKPCISQFGKEFDVEKSSQYRLTIQFALGGLSFALLDTHDLCLIAFECLTSEAPIDHNELFRALEQSLEAKGMDNKDFESVTCIIDNRFNTLVPEPVFSNADKESYLELLFQLPNSYIVQAEKLSTTQGYNVYAWSKALQDRVLAKWKNANITHASSIFIDSVMQNETETGVFANIYDLDFDMTIKKEGNLLFFNNFKFNTKEDFAYFLLFAMEQNGMSGQDTPVRLCGLILPDSEIINLCRHYVKDICIVEVPNALKKSEALNEVPFQYYYTHYQILRHKTSGHKTRDI